MGTEPKLDTLYATIGEMQTCRRISELFHARIAKDSVLMDVFPKNLAPTTERLALFLAERLGGPTEYSARRGKQSLRCRHAHLPIGPTEAARWLGHMYATIDDVGITDPARQVLHDYFTETAATLSDPFLSLYHLPLDELRDILIENPALATKSHMGRTLLSAAAGEWDLPRVQMLIEYGADVNVKDRLGHDPLYRAANALAPGREDTGRVVVAVLIQHGASVNVRSGPCQTTALHMAARRGSVGIAGALLDAGAEIEAKDVKGETPLRRAVNCNQEGVVRLLLSRGAHPLTRDKSGRTALDAARNEPIRQALQKALRR